jgi:hypothetical protein
VKQQARRCFPLFERETLKLSGWWSAGVGYQNIDPPKTLDAGLDQTRHVDGIGNVGRDAQHLGPGGTGDLNRNAFNSVSLSGTDNQRGAFGREFFRDCAPEPRLAAVTRAILFLRPRSIGIRSQITQISQIQKKTGKTQQTKREFQLAVCMKDMFRH